MVIAKKWFLNYFLHRKICTITPKESVEWEVASLFNEVQIDAVWTWQNDHPDTYQQFQEGLHVVRRSDRQWAGLSTDLVIEQVLMRSIKTSGGLTRG